MNLYFNTIYGLKEQILLFLCVLYVFYKNVIHFFFKKKTKKKT